MLGWKFINKKTKQVYTVISYATNATNAQDGQAMVVYTLTETVHQYTRTLYVRALSEFNKKFEKKEQ